ncbi:unnamed protein product [Cylicostephanus goldi]|uniref:Uncharacterized protein n=1 Tax=Cylicostephanus goldi TaxID=71465 RepID=A0A3P7M999_CYLGO|nr:unnamed protein product [Cylicostephanus goldi]
MGSKRTPSLASQCAHLEHRFRTRSGAFSCVSIPKIVLQETSIHRGEFVIWCKNKLILHDLYNVNLRAIREVIWDWYCGRQKDIPHTEIAFAGAPPNLEEFLDKISHKITEEDEDGRYVLLKRPLDGEMKKLLVPSGESRLIISDYYDGLP